LIAENEKRNVFVYRPVRQQGDRKTVVEKLGIEGSVGKRLAVVPNEGMLPVPTRGMEYVRADKQTFRGGLSSPRCVRSYCEFSVFDGLKSDQVRRTCEHWHCLIYDDPCKGFSVGGALRHRSTYEERSPGDSLLFVAESQAFSAPTVVQASGLTAEG
jgi:hypothetical protein